MPYKSLSIPHKEQTLRFISNELPGQLTPWVVKPQQPAARRPLLHIPSPSGFYLPPSPSYFFLVPTPTPLFETAEHGFSLNDLASSWVVVGVSRLCARLCPLLHFLTLVGTLCLKQCLQAWFLRLISWLVLFCCERKNTVPWLINQADKFDLRLDR